MYKPSHYNIIFQDSEKILIFNRKTKKYIKAKAVKDRVVDIIYNNNLFPSDNKSLKRMWGKN